MENKKLYSYHIFMLPFRIKDIESFRREIKSKGWKYKKYEIEDNKNYNENTYFHYFANKALFNIHDENGDGDVFAYEYDSAVLKEYVIEKKMKDGVEKYILPIDRLSLVIYPGSDIAVISIHVNNYDYTKFDDYLDINDFGRRIFPQYLPLDSVKSSFLADRLYFSGKSDDVENFSEYDDVSTIKKCNKIPKFISSLLPDNHLENILTSIDDRMFVICWAIHDRINTLTQYDNKDKSYSYESSEDWHRFLFVDNADSTCKSKNMLPDLLKMHTYERWIDSGILYGITRHSFVVLGKDEWFFENIILTHIKSMYFRMALLALVYRASYLKFADDITNISKKLDNKEDTSKEAEKVYKKYIKFLNNIFFKEVTAQEQGIDIFDMMMKSMRLNESIADLESDFRDLFNYIKIVMDEKRNKVVTYLTGISGLGLIAASIFGYYGSNVMLRAVTTENKYCIDTVFLWLGVAASLLVIPFTLYVLCKMFMDKMFRDKIKLLLCKTK